MNTILRIGAVICAFLLISVFLLPLLPAPFHTVILVVLVLAAIFYIMEVAGVLRP